MKNRRAIIWRGEGQYQSVPLEPSNKTEQTLLVIPRSEVLQKEMALSAVDNLAQLLPYSPKDMAYSLAASDSRALLYAIPEEKIKRILEHLERNGVSVDEVVSEDQALFWFFRDRAAGGTMLVIDANMDRTLFLAMTQDAIILSRTYAPEEAIKNVLSEVSFWLLESGTRPARLFVSSPSMQEAAAGLDIPIDVCPMDMPSAAKCWGSHACISLLPSQRKIQKWRHAQNKRVKQALFFLGLFTVCFSLLLSAHLFLLKAKKTSLEKESAGMATAISEVRRISASLEAVNEAECSKARLLLLLKELAERSPSIIRLKELQMQDKNIVFQGESPSHALLTEMVQVFEKIDGVKDSKLEHARLRKRINQDFFDFEVSARWQN